MDILLDDISQDWPNILIVDDDKRIRDLLSRYLWEHEFVAIGAEDAARAREFLERFEVDAMIVDVMMPGETGVEFTRSIRESRDTPILMLTALGESDDRITGLEAGADDYLPKPFEPKELLLRLKSLLKRSKRQPTENMPARVEIGPWGFDTVSFALENAGERVSLTQMEGLLLKALLSTPNTPVSREELAKMCGGDVTERTIDVQITRLRRKIEEDSKQPRYIQTMRGRGYMLRLQQKESDRE